MTVFAGVRNLAAGDALQAKAGKAIIPVQLDVTDGESIKKAADLVARHVGEAGLSGLVNNAGIAIGSPLELIPLQQLRRQLEVNVIGQIAVTQAVLPLLRRSHGRIVNMGSIAGRGTIPMMGPYSASKHALEALTDALRLELYPWGIEVSIIEPGAVATPIWDKSMQVSLDVESEMPADGRHLYEACCRADQRGSGTLCAAGDSDGCGGAGGAACPHGQTAENTLSRRPRCEAAGRHGEMACRIGCRIGYLKRFLISPEVGIRLSDALCAPQAGCSKSTFSEAAASAEANRTLSCTLSL